MAGAKVAIEARFVGHIARLLSECVQLVPGCNVGVLRHDLEDRLAGRSAQTVWVRERSAKPASRLGDDGGVVEVSKRADDASAQERLGVRLARPCIPPQSGEGRLQASPRKSAKRRLAGMTIVEPIERQDLLGQSPLNNRLSGGLSLFGDRQKVSNRGVARLAERLAVIDQAELVFCGELREIGDDARFEVRGVAAAEIAGLSGVEQSNRVLTGQPRGRGLFADERTPGTRA